MEKTLAWTVENWPLMLGIVYGLLNLLNGILKLVPGDQLGEESGKGFLPTARKLVDKISVLTAKDGAGTVKAPLASSKPVD